MNMTRNGCLRSLSFGGGLGEGQALDAIARCYRNEITCRSLTLDQNAKTRLESERDHLIGAGSRKTVPVKKGIS